MKRPTSITEIGAALDAGDPELTARYRAFCQRCAAVKPEPEPEPERRTGQQYLNSLGRPLVPEDAIYAFALDSDKVQPHLWDGPERRRYRRNLIARLRQAQNDLTGLADDFTDEDRREFPDLFEQFGM